VSSPALNAHARRMPTSFVLVAIAALLLSAVAVAAPSAAPTTLAVEASPSGRYIVLLADAPLAAYQGGVAGLAATDPSVTGADRLDPSTPASVAYLAYLDGRQAAAVSAIEAALGRDVEVVFDYDATINGLAIELSRAEAGVVAGLPGVARVSPDEERFLQTDNGPDWIGAPGVWDGSATGVPGTRGEGVVVGIIDTGVNTDHPSFADVGGDGYDHANPKGRFFGLCDPLTGTPFCNEKLIGVYDFTGTGPEDDVGHGSHTASTTAGNVLTAELLAPTITFTLPISGVAPHANIITYKGCSALGCNLAGLIAAIDQATLDMVDVINYSIGGSVLIDPWTDPDGLAFLGARRAGVFAAVSAGNEGPGPDTVGTPADAPWVTAVGASTHDVLRANSLVDMAGGGTAAPVDMHGKSITSGLPSAHIVYAGDLGFPLCGDGAADPVSAEAAINPFPPGTFNGEIVVCDRGTYGRVEKSENVMEGGAGGFVLLNDEASGDSIVADAYPIPGVGLSHADGLVLKAWLASGSGHTAAITGTIFDENANHGDVMASFSSRGPNLSIPDLLKPDVTAPGVDILAAFNTVTPDSPPEYNIISGTSMSSPHTAGAAALLAAVHPDWSPDEIKSAMMTTAFTNLPGNGQEVHDVFKEDAATPADPFDMGAGRVDLLVAGRAGLVLDETALSYDAANPSLGGDPKTLNLASMADAECAGSCAWQRTVTGTANGAVTWTASATGPEGLTVSVTPTSFTLGPGESQALNIEASVAGLPEGSWQFGQILLTPSDASVPPAHLPVAVNPQVAVAAPVLDDPGATSTTGAYDLTWSDVDSEAGYRVQQATDFTVLFADDAEAGLAGRWTADPAIGGWDETIVRANSGEQSYTSPYLDAVQEGAVRTSTLTLAAPVQVPTGTEATIGFASWEDLEPGFDFGYVEASSDGGATWETFLTVNGNSGGWVERQAALPGIEGDLLVRFRFVADQLIGAPLFEGWYVDDIQIAAATWSTIGETDADETTLAVTDQVSDTYFHRVAGLYGLASDLTLGPWSNVVDITVERPPADLRITSMTASNPRPRAGQAVTLSAVVTNSGDAASEASQTEFRLEDGAVIGVAGTPGIAPGTSVQVSVSWNTKGLSGEFTIVATADIADAVDEADEANNTGRLTVTIRGNKVQNSSFEEPNQAGTGPAAWSGSDSGAGTTSWSEGGTDGERSVTITGTGGSAAVSGVATWTSDPIAVDAGEVLTLTARVRVDGASSAPSVGVSFLGPTGELLQTVAVLSAPLRTDGFALLERTLTVPAGATELRVVLAGFAPTDVRTRGSVTFDEIGLFGE